MKLLIFFIVGCLIGFETFATAQEPDYLIYQGDTLAMQANPLESYYNKNNPRPEHFFAHEGWSTACYRGYIAYWLLENNQLYLLTLWDCEREEKANLAQFFPEKVENGRVKADWVNGTLRCVKGEILHYEHGGYGSIYAEEIDFSFEKGIFKQKKFYTNGIKTSEYTQNLKSLHQFFQKNIDWKKLEQVLSSEPRKNVLVCIEVREFTKVKIIHIRADDELLRKEIERVTLLVPNWTTIYRRGKVVQQRYCFPVSLKKP